MTDETLLMQYFDEIRSLVAPAGLNGRIIELANRMVEVREKGAKIMLAGNGASASMASHYALDFTKQASVRSIAFNDPTFLTAMGNDFGYEKWIGQALNYYAHPDDVVILISSSGRSPNVVEGASVARKIGCMLVTFTGFDENNPLKTQGQLNFWLGSKLYNVVESIHATWLGAICDLVAERVRVADGGA